MIFLELKRRYFVLLGLADNLLAYQLGENIFDARLNNSMADDACSVKNEICMWVISA